ncbi:hypothetical protein [Nocardioides exalbidus]|nr:hypothetical protein [Nocardioides exalbidus]
MDGTDVGDVCVPESQVEEVNIAELAIREFKRLTWPSSELVVQPPGGKTLVNLETNFYTTNDQVSTRTVTLAGRRVEIRAMPSYTFKFGDGQSTATTNPGRPHPNLDVTHVYLATGDVVVSVDTTYAGQFRIGDGDWQSIPDALTVAGAGSDLRVVEALPQLVIR